MKRDIIVVDDYGADDAFMVLAVDDDVPETVSEAIRRQEAVRDLWTIRLGRAR